MKNLSVSISGNGTVSDDVAERLQAVAEELKTVQGIYVTVGVTDAPAAEQAP